MQFLCFFVSYSKAALPENLLTFAKALAFSGFNIKHEEASNFLIEEDGLLLVETAKFCKA